MNTRGTSTPPLPPYPLSPIRFPMHSGQRQETHAQTERYRNELAQELHTPPNTNRDVFLHESVKAGHSAYLDPNISRFLNDTFLCLTTNEEFAS